MDEKVENAVRSVLKLDPEFDAIKAETAIDVLNGRIIAGERLDRLLSRAEAAHHLHCTPQHVDVLARKKLIRKVCGTGSRNAGIPASSVKAYLERKAVAELNKKLGRAK